MAGSLLPSFYLTRSELLSAGKRYPPQAALPTLSAGPSGPEAAHPRDAIVRLLGSMKKRLLSIRHQPLSTLPALAGTTFADKSRPSFSSPCPVSTIVMCN